MLQAVMDAAAATARRVDAVLPEGEDYRDMAEGEAAVLFAGTDLPGREVLGVLDHNATVHAEHVDEFGVAALLKSVQVHVFLFGFECARRTETDRRVP